MSSPDPTATTTAAAAATPATVTSAPATATTKSTSIKAVTGFSKWALNALLMLCYAVIKGLTGNPAFPNPPVDLTTFTATANAFSVAIVDALDGGKNAIAAQKKQRQLATQALTLLAVYVQNNCNDDPAIFASSGFTAKAKIKTANQPVAVPAFRSVDLGVNSGQLLVSVSSVAGAKAYFVRYAVMTGTTPGAWTIITVPSLKTPMTLSGMTPGATYGFEVQALGTLGYSDWSTTETIMCT